MIVVEEIRNIVKTNLGTIVSAAPAPRIFHAHHLQRKVGKIHVKPSSSATYYVEPLGKTSNSCNNLSAKTSEDTSQAEDAKTGSIIITYALASASSSKNFTKRLFKIFFH